MLRGLFSFAYIRHLLRKVLMGKHRPHICSDTGTLRHSAHKSDSFGESKSIGYRRYQLALASPPGTALQLLLWRGCS